MSARIEIRSGSASDQPKMRAMNAVLEQLNVPYEQRVLSAHRTPQHMAERARALEQDGFLVSIAAAGGAAHLPGMTASETVLPVIGLPIEPTHTNGLDSLYSIQQMPKGIPVGTVGIGQAESAAYLALQMLAVGNPALRARIRKQRGLPQSTDPLIDRHPIVHVLVPQEWKVPSAVYTAITETAHQFGISASVEAISDAESSQAIDALDRAGTSAIIALAPIGDDETHIHFPKRIAASTILPVIAVPLSATYGGAPVKLRMAGTPQDDPLASLLCDYSHGTAKGFPLAGMGFNALENGVIYAAQIIGMHNRDVRERVRGYRAELARSVLK